MIFVLISFGRIVDIQEQMFDISDDEDEFEILRKVSNFIFIQFLVLTRVVLHGKN